VQRLGFAYAARHRLAWRGGVAIGPAGVGLALAASQQLLDLAALPALSDTTFYRIADAAWPLSVLFMLVVGGVTAARREWAGWQRWTPLLCGFAVPILMTAMALGNIKALGLAFGVYTTAAWWLLGYAV